jgi:glucose/arabinose dehydrogenase
MRKRLIVWWAVMDVFVSAGASVNAATVPAGFSDTLFADGLSRPTAMAFAPDGRIFVCEQGGNLRVINNGVLLEAPFVTLTVDSTGERGLLGIAFDPDFESNKLVYVYHTVPGSPAHNRITRFTANGDTAAAGSALVILNLDPLSNHTNHNGGAIHFGSDGMLYAAVGENANGANSQSLDTRLGKILRINKDGTIPSDNPTLFDGLSGTTSGVNRAIWAVGLRNPFTSSFQRTTSKLFINDVGENTWEEVNRGSEGANYGWPATEGPTINPEFTSPVYAYQHEIPAGCAITGGTFYDPEIVQFPASYVGQYFFADYCGGWIYYIDGANPVGAKSFAAGITQPVDLTVGSDGALYYLARGPVSGKVGRIDYTGSTDQAIVTSTDRLTINEGSSGAFTVRLANQPAADVTINLAETSGDASVTLSTASLIFTPANWNSPMTITAAAAEDSDLLDHGATVALTSSGLSPQRVVVTAVDNDPPAGSPRAIVALPQNGDVVAGANAEFFGDGVAGTVVKAEFYVDGVGKYTDVNSLGHYHYGGDHNMWDTTTLSNGTHTLQMTVYDNLGLSAGHQITVTVSN